MAIYQVTTKISADLSDVRIVDAKTKSQAISHTIRNNIEAKALTAGEVVKLMQSGIVVETAINEVAETPEEIPTPAPAQVDNAA